MREILFRGKDPETGRWYEGQYIHLHKTTYCFDTDYAANPDNDIHQIVFERMTDWGLPNQHFRVDVDPDTVGQYTGLKDKNGRKIFEGDILKVHSGYWEGDTYLTRVWAEGATICVNVQGEDYDYTAVNFADDLWSNNGDEPEVIGNIHDNPELLQGGN